MSSDSSDSEPDPEPTSGPLEEDADSKLLLERREARTARQCRRSTWIYLGLPMGVLAVLLVGAAIALGVSLSGNEASGNQNAYDKAIALLNDYPLIDG